jgi:hypothetical protein
MLFAKGNLRAALTLAREEGMLDGQDPTVVMNKCSEVQLDAAVQLEIEVCARGEVALRIALDKESATRVITPALAWPAVLRMHVSVKSLSVRCDAGMWPCYLVAKRVKAEKVSEELSRLLRKLADKGVKYAVKVSAGEEQAK